jgi:hypothetical protein
MEGNCEACAWIDRAQSGAISRDLAICGPGYSHASLCIVARSRPVSIAASTQTFADCDRPVGTWPAACQFDRVDLPST